MASSEERLALLIVKCKSNSEIDAKVDAVTKLQAEFQAGVELVDIDGLIAGLKSCLRTPNQHLIIATLSAIAPLFPLLVRHRPPSPDTQSSSSNSSSSPTDFAILRQALNAFLPSGGILDRLGDNREKARDKAREALLIIGSVVFKSTGVPSQGSRGKAKGPETPLQLYERYLREHGLVNKSWRVREQSILTLVHLRRTNPLFPLRPFLPPLVDALEDGDGTVRECARQAVAEIFTAPGVTDAARADLKKEMTKKGVRKTIVDTVLAKLSSGEGRNTPSNDSVEGKEEAAVLSSIASQEPSTTSLPLSGPSATHVTASDVDKTASRADVKSGDQDEKPIYVASTRDLENEFARMLPFFEGKETEHNWLPREQSVIRIRGMLRGDAYTKYSETFIAGLKNGILDGTLKALASLRTTLASCTCSLYNDLALFLGSALDPFVEVLLTHLLKMAGFTKKIVATASQAVVESILTHTSCHPRQTIPLLWGSTQDKTVQARTFGIGHVKTFLDHHGLRSKHSIDATGGADLLEKCVKKGLADQNPGVREKARLAFWSFEAVWKDRGHVILEGLDASARKQLQNVCPVAGLSPVVSSTPVSKKSSVAAAIAASRAKAKQIATAPPTLRHQATSTSAQGHRATSPSASMKRTPSPVINAPPSSPSPLARSPSSSRSSRLRTSDSLPTSGHYRYRTQSSSPSPPSSPLAESHRSRISSTLTTHSLKRKSFQPSAPTAHPRTSSEMRTSPSKRQDDTFGSSSPFDADDSLLTAIANPLPADDSGDDGDSTNLITFSAPWELSQSTSTQMTSSMTSSKQSPSTSRIIGVPDSVVEDALRARAAQAESAAEQLLELVEPDDIAHADVSPIPPSLLPSNKATPKAPIKTLTALPVTPLNQTSAIMRQAAMFQDSPAYNPSPQSIFESIEERKHQTGWWLKRMSIIDRANPVKSDYAECIKDLDEYIVALEKGVADLSVLQKLVILCHHKSIGSVPQAAGSPIHPPGSFQDLKAPTPDDLLSGDGRLERLFNALCDFLQPAKDRVLLEHGLFVLWEVLPQLDGRDADVFAMLLRLRYAQDFNVDEGTLTIRDAQVELVNERNFTLYGLSTLDLCLRNFLAKPVPLHASQDAKLRAHAFGLITMAKFIIRLPADILEEELPKIKQTLTTAYLNSETMVRQAATIAITAAQVILRDEAHLFALLEPLPDDKKNLLTYFFEKNGARGTAGYEDARSDLKGMERVSSDMDRLDQRISTPPKRSHGVI